MSASSFWVLFWSLMFSSRACSTEGIVVVCLPDTLAHGWSHLGDLLFLLGLLRLIVLHLLHNMRRREGHGLTSHTLHRRGRICNYWVVIKERTHCSVWWGIQSWHLPQHVMYLLLYSDGAIYKEFGHSSILPWWQLSLLLDCHVTVCYNAYNDRS